jgi:SecD/SecF fusion protein
VGAYKLGTTNVSSSFGHQIAVDAIWGIVVSMFLITIYIALRFSFKFALPVIIAMLHDIIITVGVYSLAYKEVSVATVAAVLTVLGYSIYDTIIIFDRIRENIPLMRKQPMATITNVSLWETIRRSLATTFITLPDRALEILGGSTLKTSRSRSSSASPRVRTSIFIAAPLLTWWKERERSSRAEAAGPRLTAPCAPDGRRGRRVDAAAHSPSPETCSAAEPTPSSSTSPGVTLRAGAQARREKRRQRRRTRPHGRAR